MGRRRIIRKEPLTTLSVYLADAMIVDDEQRPSESSKADTIRRIFTDYFGDEKIKEKWKEVRKKVDRQQSTLGNDHGDQSTIDGVYFPKKTFKDTVYSQSDLLDMIIEGKELKGHLAKATALDSMNKAINRGDIQRVPGGFKIIFRYWSGVHGV